MTKVVRVHRSELAVPGSNKRMLAKAPALGADVVMLDLEDAVAPGEKDGARANVIEALSGDAWTGVCVSLRINGLDTEWAYRDIVDVIEAVGRHVDTVMVPKVGTPSDVEFVGTLLSQIEQRQRLDTQIGIAVLIETAQGMASVESIARSCPSRLEAMVFGVADYAASMQSQTTTIGGANPSYAVLTDGDDECERARHWGDQWHFALSRIAVACRANGLRPIDGPYGDFQDPDGYLAAARRAAALGYEGKWAIHPNQIGLANAVFTPAQSLVVQTHRIVAAMKEAERDGAGAVSLDGRLIDAASIRMAENLLAKLEQIDAREQKRAIPPAYSAEK